MWKTCWGVCFGLSCFLVFSPGDHGAQLVLGVGPVCGGLYVGQAPADRCRGADRVVGSHPDRYHVQGIKHTTLMYFFCGFVL